MRTNISLPTLQYLFAFVGVLMLIGSFGAWETKAGESASALGTWQGTAAFAGGLLIIFGALLSYGFLRIEWLESRKPLSDPLFGIIGGVLGIIGAIAGAIDVSGRASIGWGLYLTIVTGLLALFISYLIYKRESPAIPSGLLKTIYKT